MATKPLTSSPLLKKFAKLDKPENNRLAVGFLFSLAIHALVMAIHFTLPLPPPARTPGLDVILVNARHDTAPKDPQALAQANMDGGGDNNEDIRATSPLPPQESARDGNDLVDTVRGNEPVVQQQPRTEMLSQQSSTVAIAKRDSTADKPPVQQASTGTDAANAAAMRLQLEAEIAERTRAYNQRPRRKQIGPRTQEYRFAQYIEAWRIKAERIGDLNYPPAARGRLYDSLVMTVSINRDGTIEKVAINRPSRYPVLNEAAERIVRLGEPYSPFPPDIAKDFDILDITRTWTFTNNKLGVISQPK